MITKKSISQKIFLKEIGKFFKIFTFLFLVIFIAINWQSLKVMFNYKTVYGDIFDVLKKGNYFLIPTVQPENTVKPENTVQPEISYNQNQQVEIIKTEKPDSIEIPKIELEAPLIFINSKEKKDYIEALKKGAVHWAGSVLPGEKGMTVILGHSAPYFWPKKDYNWIFRRLNELEEGDEIFINFKNKKYRYLVTKKLFLKPGEEIPVEDLTKYLNMVSLISCYPPETGIKRILVQGVAK